VLFLLSESHCSAHTFWEEGEVYIDLFCCRDFDIEKALKIFCDALEPTDVHFEMVDR
jgi:S-adenosylmethionine/arginine decarboxylase-like enzyme